jgi:hypothetical protein
LLTSIPDTLINLTTLNCSSCPLLTSIPDTLINLTTGTFSRSLWSCGVP